MKDAIRKELLHAAKVLGASGCLPATDGNFSARLPESRILLTRSGIEKRTLCETDIVELSLAETAPREASSEWRLHRTLYSRRSDIGCILHVHSPGLTAFAMAQRAPRISLLAEAAMAIGEIAVARFAAPGTELMGEAALDASTTARVYLLSNHGAVAVGKTVRETLHRLERAEFLARTELAAASIGGGVEISDSDLLTLQAGS